MINDASTLRKSSLCIPSPGAALWVAYFRLLSPMEPTGKGGTRSPGGMAKEWVDRRPLASICHPGPDWSLPIQGPGVPKRNQHTSEGWPFRGGLHGYLAGFTACSKQLELFLSVANGEVQVHRASSRLWVSGCY